MAKLTRLQLLVLFACCSSPVEAFFCLNFGAGGNSDGGHYRGYRPPLRLYPPPGALPPAAMQPAIPNFAPPVRDPTRFDARPSRNNATHAKKKPRQPTEYFGYRFRPLE